jgi:hypothetical protein
MMISNICLVITTENIDWDRVAEADQYRVDFYPNAISNIRINQ